MKLMGFINGWDVDPGSWKDHLFFNAFNIHRIQDKERYYHHVIAFFGLIFFVRFGDPQESAKIKREMMERVLEECMNESSGKFRVALLKTGFTHSVDTIQEHEELLKGPLFERWLTEWMLYEPKKGEKND